jgi:hypothetical protein
MNRAGLAEPMGAEAEFTSASYPASVKDQLKAYWRSLKVSDPALIETLSDECLARAQRRLGHGTEGEFLRHALEEAQRRFDQALARALRLPPSKSTGPVAAARAAFLFSADQPTADGLFQSAGSGLNLGGAFRKALPNPTPPEAHLSMPEAPLRFWLFKSPPG